MGCQLQRLCSGNIDRLLRQYKLPHPNGDNCQERRGLSSGNYVEPFNDGVCQIEGRSQR